MLKCDHLTVRAGGSGAAILEDICANFPGAQLNALVGPSGCGKTTLIKAFLGLVDAEGSISRDSTALGVGRLGFVPQFSLAHENLTVRESLSYVFDLTVCDRSVKERRLSEVLNLIGLSEHFDKQVSSLSGGQMRRLGLGLELVGDSDCLICDEVTSGLDPLSEDQIIALLRSLVEARGKSFICTIHNLAKLADFDHITVLYVGRLVFQGDFETLKAWFGIGDPLRLYHSLAEQPLEFWLEKWEKNGLRAQQPCPVKSEPERTRAGTSETSRSTHGGDLPGSLSQLGTLLRRRGQLLMRDTGYLWLLLALTFGFPCIVVIFAMKGLPQIEGLALERSGSFIQQLQGDLRYQMAAAETAKLVTGLVMFQVVLLTLMGSNNGAREIAGERQIYEKERIKGLRPGVYASSKLIFTGAIALAQGVWMALFVKVICQFPGDFLPQLTMMALCCVAMTFVCLAMSATFASAERASLLSIYLVGFQFPLSGIVLALPDTVVWVLRPFINAYWSWSGYFASMKEFQVYDAHRMQDVSWMPDVRMAAIVLFLHMLAGAALVWHGCRRRQWL